LSALNLALLGSFEASANGKLPVKFRTSRAQALLAYLATEFALGVAHQRREALMELLWPGMPPDSARTNLRQNLYYLRQGVPGTSPSDGGKAIPFLLSDRQTVAVNLEYPLEFDVRRFVDLLAGPQEEWVEAVALYRGDFLTDFYLADANPFEEWAAARRAAFRRQVLDALELLTDSFVTQGRMSDGERYARQQLAIDPLRETAYRQLMKVLYWSGRRVEALQLYLECTRLLEAELDTGPSEATRALAEAVRKGTVTGRPKLGQLESGADLENGDGETEAAETREEYVAPSAPAEQASAVRHNLPVYATSFIGREAELATLDGLITDPNVRLITIVGPGGIGKTRLAIAAAERVLATNLFSDGLVFIDLAPLQETGQILVALADALRFPLTEPDDPASLQHLLDYLRQKTMLLVFDNLDHLLDSVRLVTDILQAGPTVKILATSRERLRSRLEQAYPLGGLAIPDRAAPEDAAEYMSARLFLQSARRCLPDFTLRDDQDRTDLARICRLVAGMPLALELAASWVDMLSLADIAGELQQGLDILESELRDVPERQRSVRASIDYTWRRLDDAEQAVFAQLSIFRGGFTRAAVQAVTGASLRQLSRLVTKSLIRFDKQRDRYQVHELLRQFGHEKLRRSPDLEAAAYDRHCDYFCQLMEDQADELKGSGKRQALSTIEADLENIRLAWNHASSQRNYAAIGMAIESLWRFYADYGRRDVGELEKAVAELRTSAATREQRIVIGRLLAPLGRFHGDRGDKAMAKEMLEESLEILRSHGALEESLLPLLFLADVQGSIEESTQMYREGLALAREIDDPWAIGHALVFLGWNARLAGDYQDGQRHAREAVKQFRQNGDIGGIVTTNIVLGMLSIDLGLYEDALALGHESRSLTVGFNPMFRLPGVRTLGLALYAQARYEEAEELFRQGLAVSREFGREHMVRDWLYWLGQNAFHRQNYVLAAQRFRECLSGAVESNHLELVLRNHNALGRLDIVQSRGQEAKGHFREALQLALQLAQRPLLLDCLANIAELYAEEDNLDDAALLAMRIMNDPASRARIRERAALLLAHAEAELPSDELNAIRQRSNRSDLGTVAAGLLHDLETP
jgi:predicted ATPase/DNA-binding SARP family transcriptional activator